VLWIPGKQNKKISSWKKCIETKNGHDILNYHKYYIKCIDFLYQNIIFNQVSNAKSIFFTPNMWCETHKKKNVIYIHNIVY